MTLNEEQTRAVETDASKVVVIAGPGSGKTRVEVERVKWIARGMDSIAIMTFTNNGAAEFRERLGDLAAKLAWCGTTHSYCFMLIQRFGAMLGYKPGTVSILPEAEKIPRLLRVRDTLGMKISQKALLAHGPIGNPLFQGSEALVWKEYEFLLKQSNLVDYDGILSEGLRLLGMEDVRSRIQIDHLLVDEFQDSKKVDVEIYQAIPAANWFFVGDPDQSIFSFRQAKPRLLVDLAQSKEVTTFELEKNYRSKAVICQAANMLIAQNKRRIPKMTLSVVDVGGQVEVDEYPDGWAELAAIAGCISITLVTRQSMAVLFRNNFEVDQCYQHLKARGLPVKVKSARKPDDLERAIILLSLTLDPDNAILLERYLLLDSKPAEVTQLLLAMQASKIPIRAKAEMLTGGNWHMMLMTRGVSESTLFLIKSRAALMPERFQIIDLIHDLRSYDPEIESTDDSEAEIYVGTYHSAKGREWDVVFLPAFEQGLIPNSKSLKLVPPFCDYPSHQVDVPRPEIEGSKLEEERRLAFVALTRARSEVHVSWAAEAKGKWGPRSLGIPSQFLQEMGLQ